ncbi:putative Histidine kinase [Candidatus Zixiibacteriota bacterium]|nr:putative Histidine kinase [candidate division Zixibacteria bacterium]
MKELETLIETAAIDLVMVSLDDLPSLARLHDDFLNAAKEAGETSGPVGEACRKLADLVEKIVLGEIPEGDRGHIIDVLNDAVAALQGLVRDHRQLSEVLFPKELNLSLPGEAMKPKTDVALSPESPASAENKPDKPAKMRPASAPQAPRKDEARDQSLIINLESADTSLLGDFINEAREHCATAEQMLMDLETDCRNQAAIDAIFRSFHTIKGAAGFLDLKPVSVLAHESETLLDFGRKGTLTITGHIADTIFDAIDVLRKLLEGTEMALKNGGTFDGTSITVPVLAKLRQLIEHPDQVPSEPRPERVGDILIQMGAVSQPQIDEALTKKKSTDEKLGETLVNQGIVPAKVVAQALRNQQQVIKEKTGTGAVKEVVKIDTERLDRLVDTIGELVIAESMVGQDEEILGIVSPKIARNISHLNKITRELQEMGMAMRLVPVRPTFQKLARAVRDLTKKSGKEIELILSGEDTEVDRSIVENIGDPLMHMIRNSVDHGIETPADRVHSGKSRNGKITVRAYHKGGNIYFDIEDDGRGLNKDKILAKAREKGLIEGNKELTDKEIYGLIMLPGFSTAEKVTDISGRGVGMDVVRKNIEAMRGHLEIQSISGKGTLFLMKLPLTLAIIDGMLVSVENEKLIIPTLSIVESLSLTKEMIFTVTGRAEMIDLRGDLLPLIRVNELFEFKPVQGISRDKTVVVVEDGSKRVGLVVDKLLGQRQTVIKSLGPIFRGQKWVAGGAILSDGNVGLIIDVGGVVALAAQSLRPVAVRETEASDPEVEAKNKTNDKCKLTENDPCTPETVLAS